MPFRTDDGGDLEELVLAQRPADGYRFRLRAGFDYEDPVSGRRYEVGAGRASDLASVPSWLWSFIASYGRQSAPAVLHDDRSDAADALGDRRAALVQRREDDRVFRTALREQRVPLLRAWLMWAWVSADRERALGGVAGAVFMVQAVLGALVVVGASVAAFWNPVWLAAALVPALATVPWWRLAPLMLLLNYATGLLAPLVALHLVALVPFRLIEAIVELATGGDPVGVLRPTVRPPSDRSA
ncbi:DUF1353 domain-containing protein [Agromyces sp. H66]|uniref:DUF1353 domain-containing protein n=1 Tax=Agromyces sp. H66 TaxID=2529859 RepID=UPI00145B5A4C|nr:DUF1353 domain-containing protein [Agromyces sp. H66]